MLPFSPCIWAELKLMHKHSSSFGIFKVNGKKMTITKFAVGPSHMFLWGACIIMCV